MEREIINIAIDNLNHQPGIQAEWYDDGELDGLLKVVINRKEFVFNVEVKKELRQ